MFWFVAHTKKKQQKKLVVLAPARQFIVCARRANYRHRHKAVKAVKIYDHISVVSARIVSTICSCEFVLFTNVHLKQNWANQIQNIEFNQVNESTESHNFGAVYAIFTPETPAIEKSDSFMIKCLVCKLLKYPYNIPVK